jgi:ubiquinone/menaquinone biosynthesis C-methylase UbiE
MLLKRSYTPESMDDFSVKDERVDRALKELRIVNKFLGGTSSTLKGIKKLSGKENNKKFTLLDAGSGGADIFSNSHFKKLLTVYALDKNIRACHYLKEQEGGEVPVCGDVLKIPFKDRSFDIIHASLFLHHFNEMELQNIISAFLRMARRGIIINDLRRAFIAYVGIKLITSLFSKSDMVKNDAPLSVRRGFTLKELKMMMEMAGIKNYSIERKWAFRWLIVIGCNEN